MLLWRSSFDAVTGGHTHLMAHGFGHALLVPMIVNVFRALRISASVHDGSNWWVIHHEPGVGDFEAEHEADALRVDYNQRSLKAATRTGKTVRGNNRGYVDLFVPIKARGSVVAMLVSGGFATHRKTGPEIIAEWRHLSGRQGHVEHPEFYAYVQAALSMLVLESSHETRFVEMLERMADLLGGDGPADALANQIDALHLELRKLRFVERDWSAVAAMLDDRFPRSWSGAARRSDLAFLGLSRAPDHVLVALASSRSPHVGPVDEMVRRDAFQRAAGELATRIGKVVAGRAGDRAVVFLAAARASVAEKRRRLTELAERTALMARRRFDLSLHCGASIGEDATAVTRSYQSAFGAAESALSRGQKLVFAEHDEIDGTALLRNLRRSLSEDPLERKDFLIARFERYAESVAVQVGERLELGRVHLEVGFERLLETMHSNGAFDTKGLLALRHSIDRGAKGARTVAELLEVYRVAIGEVGEALTTPVSARQGRSLQRALEFVHQHFAERLPIERVAKIGGFAPAYFSRLFRRREGMTFEQYVAGLRLERAKQLLSTSDISIARVAELSGFGSPQYLARVCRRVLRMTPRDYRTSHPPVAHHIKSR
jgi:AraC-like DNA-binding protein